jgi:membrane protease YdiL (CAAX protease family)
MDLVLHRMNDIQDASLHSGTENTKPETRVWGPWETIGFGLVVGMTFIAAQALVVVAFIATKIISDSTLNLLQITENLSSNGLLLALAVFASAIVGVGLIVVFIKLRRNANIAEYLGLRPISKKSSFILLAITIGLIILLESISIFLVNPQNDELMVEAYKTSVWPALLWIATVIFAPAFEETFFRGFLFVGLKQSRIGSAGTIIITALTWTLLHIQYDIYGMTLILILGIVLGIVRLRTGSLWSPLLIHSFWNLVAMVGTALYASGLIS